MQASINTKPKRRCIGVRWTCVESLGKNLEAAKGRKQGTENMSFVPKLVTAFPALLQ